MNLILNTIINTENKNMNMLYVSMTTKRLETGVKLASKALYILNIL